MAPSSMVISTGCSRASRRTRAPSSGLQNLQYRFYILGFFLGFQVSRYNIEPYCSGLGANNSGTFVHTNVSRRVHTLPQHAVTKLANSGCMCAMCMQKGSAGCASSPLFFAPLLNIE